MKQVVGCVVYGRDAMRLMLARLVVTLCVPTYLGDRRLGIGS